LGFLQDNNKFTGFLSLAKNRAVDLKYRTSIP